MAATNEPEAAAAKIGLYGEGLTIRYGHAKKRTVWTEGADADGTAADSYDVVAFTVWGRIDINDWWDRW
ncbi:MAG: hypothetical protein OXG11_06805 [Chloroflexi bacterium]|nr:hypothetical protein [Chloroflexota bacterium]